MFLGFPASGEHSVDQVKDWFKGNGALVGKGYRLAGDESPNASKKPEPTTTNPAPTGNNSIANGADMQQCVESRWVLVHMAIVMLLSKYV